MNDTDVAIQISEDEDFPVYSVILPSNPDLDHGLNRIVIVSKEKLERWQQIRSDYNEMQKELERLHKEAMRKEKQCEKNLSIFNKERTKI